MSLPSSRSTQQASQPGLNPSTQPARNLTAAQQRLPTQLDAGNRARDGGGNLAAVPGDGASPPKSSAKGGAAVVQAAGVTAPATQAVPHGPRRGAHPAPMHGEAKDQALRPMVTLSTIHRGGDFMLRLETHVLIQPLGPSQQTPAWLVSEVVAGYNKMHDKNANIPNMSATSAASENSWVLQHVPNSNRAKLTSPALRLFSRGPHEWYASIDGIWRFLVLHWCAQKGSYSLSADAHCRTRLQIVLQDVPPLQQLKHMAQIAGHFEPALRDLMPLDYVGAEEAVRVWLGAPSVAAIEACKTVRGLMELMNPGGVTYLGFNFSKLDCNVIEFSPGAACRTRRDFFTSAAIAATFWRASAGLQTTEHVLELPRTVDGLIKFMGGGGANGSGGVYLGMLFADYATHKTLKPITKTATSEGGASARKAEPAADHSTGEKQFANRGL